MKTSKKISQNYQNTENERKDGKSESWKKILVLLGIVTVYLAVYFLTNRFFSKEVVVGVMFVMFMAPVLVFMFLASMPYDSPRDEKLSEEERKEAKKEWRKWYKTMLVGMGIFAFLMAVFYLLWHFFSAEVAVAVVASIIFVPILAFFMLQAIEIIKK